MYDGGDFLTDIVSGRSAPRSDYETARFADVVVSFAANVQPGQVVAIEGEVGQEWLVRALAEEATKLERASSTRCNSTHSSSARTSSTRHSRP
jgi:leucyl aminopeptidase (aminopeptidase T)